MTGPDRRVRVGQLVRYRLHVLESFGGGPGRVAIHGREGASLSDPLGSGRSHGCVRISSRAVTWLARHAPPRTPVKVR